MLRIKKRREIFAPPKACIQNVNPIGTLSRPYSSRIARICDICDHNPNGPENKVAHAAKRAPPFQPPPNKLGDTFTQ